VGHDEWDLWDVKRLSPIHPPSADRKPTDLVPNVREQIDQRTLDLLARELKAGFSQTTRRPELIKALVQEHETWPEVPRPQALADVIEQITALARSPRPTLVYSMKTAFASRVTIEKTGPGAVSLEIVGWNGPPPASELARLREALRARKLRLVSISVS
jgi:hypothetical protein